MFLEWTAQYQKSYPSKEVFADKFNIFVGNYKDLENHKTLAALEGGETQGYELNKFADMTDAEYKKLLGYKKDTTQKQTRV